MYDRKVSYDRFRYTGKAPHKTQHFTKYPATIDTRDDKLIPFFSTISIRTQSLVPTYGTYHTARMQ